MPTPDQQHLIDRLRALLESQREVEGAWLSGSLATGTGDAFSDVDTLALVADGSLPSVSATLVERVAEVAEPILVKPLFGGVVIHVVTGEWQRFDIALIEGDALTRYNAADLVPLFSRTGREPSRRPEMPYAMKADALRKLVDEFLRVLGLAAVVIGREEYVLALSGIDQLRRMTIDLMLEENGIAPWKRGGALHRNPLLTADQRAPLAALPPLAAERASVIAGHAALARLFLPRAQALADRIGMAWSEAFEQATRRHLQRTIGLTF